MEILKPVVVLLLSFAVLMKTASLFVDGAVGIARSLGIPKLIVGLVLVSMATTAPEFTVSVIAAFRGESEIALGNAVGSVICDDGLAMGLAGLVAASPIVIQPRILRTTGLFIIAVDLLAFGLALDGTLGPWEGAVFLLALAAYFVFIVHDTRKRRNGMGAVLLHEGAGKGEGEAATGTLGRSVFKFVLGVAGVVIASKFVVDSAVTLATLLSVPKVIIALIGVAFGTSLPEVITCVVSARKGQGEIAVGNILGADILNILWIVGMSSVVNEIHVTQREIYFMFPSMLCIVFVMLGLMRHRYRFGRRKGLIMLFLYGVYLALALFIFAIPH